MVATVLEPEVERILTLINNGEDFLLSGGAGSGKTFSLVSVIKTIITKYPSSTIACITYTNAAVKEIEERINHNNLIVSTIHDFLWKNIKNYQKELKSALINLINDENSKITSSYREVDDSFFDSLDKGIQYKEYLRINEGIISHDELLELANYMFKNYPLLCDILKDKFKFIMIDEYQDTSPLVVEIFLNHIKQTKKKNIIGFFGDSMQSIYDGSIGDLKEYTDSGVVKEVIKLENRRNPKSVIELSNKIRNDGLAQTPSGDKNAPNMQGGTIKKGIIKFLYSIEDKINLDQIRKTKYFNGWFEKGSNTKELILTHNLIAPQAGFPNLMEIYDKDRILEYKNNLLKKIKEEEIETNITDTFGDVVDKANLKMSPVIKNFINENPELFKEALEYPFEKFKNVYLKSDLLIDDKKQDELDKERSNSKRDDLIKHLFKIQSLVHLYQQNNFNEFIRKTEFELLSIKQKREINQIIKHFQQNTSELTIEDAIKYADENGICKIDDRLKNFIEQNQYVYNRVKKVHFIEFQNLFYYLEGYTPFSTQHKTKGAEYDNVFVVLDNGKWNKYNFEYLFNNRIDKQKVLARTQKIFYVSCTRSKENLIVFYHKPSDSVIEKAKEWFSIENVHNINE